MLKRKTEHNQGVSVRCKVIGIIVLSLALFTPQLVVAENFMKGVDSIDIVVEEYSGGDCDLNAGDVENTVEYILGRDLTITDDVGCYVYVNPNMLSVADGNICAGNIAVNLTCPVTGMNIASGTVNEQFVPIWSHGMMVSGGIRVFDPISGLEELLKVFVNEWRRAQIPNAD